MIGADNGDLRIDKEGAATVTATETKADGSSEAVAWVKVISKAQKLEEIKLFIDGQDVTNQKRKSKLKPNIRAAMLLYLQTQLVLLTKPAMTH